MRFDEPVAPEPAMATRTAASAPPPPGADHERDRAGGQQDPPAWSVPARVYALTDWAMGNPGIAQVTAPATLRTQIQEAAVRIIARHSGQASSPPPSRPPVELPQVRDIENEQQLLTMCTVLAWHHVRDVTDMDDLDEVIAWLLGIPAEQLAVVEELDIVADKLETVSSRQGWAYEPLPLVALDADERVAVAAVLNRAVRLPLPEDVAVRLTALSEWLAPLLDQDRLVLEPASPEESRAAICAPRLVMAHRRAEVVLVQYRTRDGRVEERIISPWWFSAGPRYDYLYGYDHTLKSARWLRLDRVLHVTPKAEEYQQPAPEHRTPAPPPSGITSANPSTYKLLLEPKAWWLLDELSVDCWPHDAGGGALIVEVETDSPGYVNQLILRGKGHAELLAPEEGRAAICELARQVADQHAPGTP
ncbi:MAG: WYL domain-containing transcriptional regulator [Nitriliruptor sp.]|nr:MAG: WYL domain-containing transcriptional regulator [Nitriliruptor sp.]